MTDQTVKHCIRALFSSLLISLYALHMRLVLQTVDQQCSVPVSAALLRTAVKTMHVTCMLAWHDLVGPRALETCGARVCR